VTSRNVDITGLSKDHISILIESRVTRSYASSPVCIVYADMILTQFEVKVKVRAMTAVLLQSFHDKMKLQIGL